MNKYVNADYFKCLGIAGIYLIVSILVAFFCISATTFVNRISYTASGQDPYLLFLWDTPTTTTVDYSAGDSTGTANGTVQITGGEVDTNDTGTNGEDYYVFDVSSNDIIDAGGDGTIFIRFDPESPSSNNDFVWGVWADYNDYGYIDITTGGEAQFVYTDDNSTGKTVTTSSCGATTGGGNPMWIRLKWQNGTTPYTEIQCFEDNAGSMGSASGSAGTNSTDNWDLVTAAATGDFYVGNQTSENVEYQITRIAIYSNVRDTE